MSPRVAVLTYHSININGPDYASNDHVALAADLALLQARGIAIVPLAEAVDALSGDAPGLARPAVALSCDDGSWFDWHDLEHPTWGPQPSFRRLLGEARARSGEALRMSSFVIGSPAARSELDRTCLIGRGWWGDEWWPQAQLDGIDIENHSWDHNHDTLAETAQRDGRKGGFTQIDTWAEADAEIRQCRDYLWRHCAPQRSRLFAYPYGECNDYLVDDYLPRHGDQHGLSAAFSTEPRPLSAGDNRWRYGRYVCGAHWRSPDELLRLLDDAGVA